MRIKSSGGLVRALCCHSMLFLFDNTSAVALKIVFRSIKLSESPKFSPLTLLHSNYNEVVFKNVIVKIILSYSHLKQHLSVSVGCDYVFFMTPY